MSSWAATAVTAVELTPTANRAGSTAVARGETARPGAAAAAALLRSTSPSFPRSSASSSRWRRGRSGRQSYGGDAGMDGGGNPVQLSTSGGGAGTSTAGGSGGSQTSMYPAYLCSPPSSICGSAGSQLNGGHGGDANGINVPGGGGGGGGWYGEVAEPSGRVEVAVRATSQPLHLAWSRTTTAPPPRSSSAGRCRDGDHHDPGTPRRPRRKGSAPSRALAARIRTVRGAGRARIRTASPPARRSDTSTLGWDNFTLLTVQDVAAYLQLNQQARLPQKIEQRSCGSS